MIQHEKQKEDYKNYEKSRLFISRFNFRQTRNLHNSILPYIPFIHFTSIISSCRILHLSFSHDTFFCFLVYWFTNFEMRIYKALNSKCSIILLHYIIRIDNYLITRRGVLFCCYKFVFSISTLVYYYVRYIIWWRAYWKRWAKPLRFIGFSRFFCGYVCAACCYEWMGVDRAIDLRDIFIYDMQQCYFVAEKKNMNVMNFDLGCFELKLYVEHVNFVIDEFNVFFHTQLRNKIFVVCE